MSDQDSKTPSTNSSDGGGGDPSQLLVIKQGTPSSPAAGPLAICRFVNRRNGPTTVSIYWNSGGVSNGTMNNQGDVWDIHVNGDCYCWSHTGTCEPNCSLRCYPGNTYYVG
ncbi:MAG: hypothetical protein EOO38_08130 [Cytophagaceae bacterium]|nr:MAG: hypothetical protein EOO38_08130 [Cytophagaceae bacterium]